ncbi:MAG: hypothetical protein H6Q85_2587, partial [candidate division NC10 bacterium]|nr:hypothetical protein [candidate division NC10 bacterium]
VIMKAEVVRLAGRDPRDNKLRILVAQRRDKIRG